MSMGSVGGKSKTPFEKVGSAVRAYDFLVIISGSGPCGLLLALLLGQHGIKVTVLEAWAGLDQRLRATQYGVPATRVFRRAGLMDDIRAASIDSFPSIYWRRTRDHKILTGIDLSVVKDHPDRMTILPLNLLVEILYKHCAEKTNGMVEVKFNHKVVNAGQDEKQVWVDAEVEGGGKVKLEADYFVGCDGSTSAVRKVLYGREWPGVTHDLHLLAQNVWYDGFEKYGWDGGNYCIDGEYCGLIAKRGKGGLWRVTYMDKYIEGLSEEDYEKRREQYLKHLLPGNPEPDQYRIEQTDHFRSHNRCVTDMRQGRILLAGDAAHVNNPWGGYGCMSAVLDSGALADCLIGVFEGKAEEDILDLYAKIRREKFLKYVDGRSTKNMNRVRNPDPDWLCENDKLLGIFRELEGDPEGTKQFLLKNSSIEYDFTEHYC